MFIDAIGKACPQPIVLTKKAFDSGESEVEIAVDNMTAVENLTKFAKTEGLEFSMEKDGSNFRCTLKGRVSAKIGENAKVISGGASARPYTVFFASDVLGSGSDELGTNLMKMAIYTLAQSDELPEAVLFMNGGVKLPCSEVEQIISSLNDMENKGVKLLVCGTCLDFFGIKENLKVGTVSNMYDILSAMQNTKRVVRL